MDDRVKTQLLAERLGERFLWEGSEIDGFRLRDLSAPAMRPLEINFEAPEFLRRIEDSLRHPSELIRATEGRRGKEPLRIVDAMAGLGQDAYLLSRRGHQVESFESDPVIFKLLQSAMRRSPSVPSAWSLNLGDLLRSEWNGSAQVLYLDPMFPERQDGTLPGRTMQILQAWLETAKPPRFSLADWLRWASEKKFEKVVYKTPLHMAETAEELPFVENYQIQGRSVTFHIFLINSGVNQNR